MLATSIKADLVQDTLAACSRHGEAKVFDPTSSSGLPTAVWSPIAASTSWTAARRTPLASWLIREKAFGASVALGTASRCAATRRPGRPRS